MRRYRIAWLPGDGACAEVCEAARLVLDAVRFSAEYTQAPSGRLPDRNIEPLRSTDCAFCGGAVSTPAGTVRLCRLLDLYACVRPVQALPGNPLNLREDIDLVVFHGSMGGMHAAIEFEAVPDSFYREPGVARIPRDAALALGGITRHEARRIAMAAFDYAVRCGRRKVTAVHQAGEFPITRGLFLEAAHAAAGAYPEIEFETTEIDKLSLLKDPCRYDVILTTNLVGDVLSSFCTEMAGGAGFAYDGSLGDSYAVFGPAPAQAGRNQANPLGAILAAGMMVEWLGEMDIAARIEKAVADVVSRGEVRTPDMGGHASTLEMARAVIQAANRDRQAVAAAR